MELKQDGVAVSGKYEDEYSRDRNGHFRGLIKGDILRIEWIQPGNPDAAVMPKKEEHGYESSSREKLSGEWVTNKTNITVGLDSNSIKRLRYALKAPF